MIKGAYAPAKGILVAEGETSSDPFLMRARAVDNSLRKVWNPLDKLQRALDESGDADNARAVRMALRILTGFRSVTRSWTTATNGGLAARSSGPRPCSATAIASATSRRCSTGAARRSN